ncbi:hypothetical protein PZA11_003307 [Diplocarpon coronariae]
MARSTRSPGLGVVISEFAKSTRGPGLGVISAKFTYDPGLGVHLFSLSSLNCIRAESVLSLKEFTYRSGLGVNFYNITFETT